MVALVPIAAGDETRPVAAVGDFAGPVYRLQQAFLPQPKIPERYRLRFARYTVLAQDIDAWAAAAAASGEGAPALCIEAQFIMLKSPGSAGSSASVDQVATATETGSPAVGGC
jgi:hypothetical protein